MIVHQNSIRKSNSTVIAVILVCCSFFISSNLLAKNKKAPNDNRTLQGCNKPYIISGIQYIPSQKFELIQTGAISYYGSSNFLNGKQTSIGDKFNMNGISAAHKTLPLPCVIRVVNLSNKRSLKIRVNDRGPFINKRILDVSRKAAKLLGFFSSGTTIVRIETTVGDSPF